MTKNLCQNEEIHSLKYKNPIKSSVENQVDMQISLFQKEILSLKTENNKLKEMLSSNKMNPLIRKPSLNLSDRGFENKPINNNLGNFKDLLVRNQKLFEENSRLKKDFQNITKNQQEMIKDKAISIHKQIRMLKQEVFEIKSIQHEDFVKFQDLWPHMFKIFEYQQQQLMKSEAKNLSLEKEIKIFRMQIKANLNKQ